LTHADLPVHDALSSGRKSRTLHDDDSLLFVELDLALGVGLEQLLAGSSRLQAAADLGSNKLGKVAVESITEHGVGYDADILEVSGGSDSLGPVDDSIPKQKFSMHVLVLRSGARETDPEGMTKSPGAISSRRDPTAEKATIAWTPKCLRAAMLARAGTSDGLIW
jgi:hypothetical protein